ncbi:MAG: FAD-binding protein, partial [Gemmatimonadota bacterium]|nr:FAD-binding protein [Gemmatimonadota bacterium]
DSPMRIYPAPHYSMGGLWVDYNLMTTLPGLYAIGEANFSDHGANRLGASALMQCLADGYFILPITIADHLSRHPYGDIDETHPTFEEALGETRAGVDRLLSIDGTRTSESIHRELGGIMWDECGMSRDAEGLNRALKRIPELRQEFWTNLRVPGKGEQLNQALEHAGRLADFLEFSEVMCRDALQREESCGGHFREEYKTEDGEALRDDERFAHASVWEYRGPDAAPKMHREQLTFEALPLSMRSYDR